MFEQYLVFYADVGEVGNQKVEAFKNSFLNTVNKSEDLKKLGAQSSINVELLPDCVFVSIKTDEMLDIKKDYQTLAKAVVESLEGIFVTSVSALKVDYVVIISTDEKNIDPNAEKDNVYELEGVNGQGYKFALTRKGYMLDLTIEPDYLSYRDGQENKMLFVLQTTKEFRPLTSEHSKLNDVIGECHENFMYYYEKISEQVK